MWTLIRVTCWLLCPLLLAGYGATFAALLADTPHNTKLQLALVGLGSGLALYLLGRRLLSFANTLHHEATHLVLALLFLRRPRAFVVQELQGHVTFNGDDRNFLISLGPNFVPIAAMLWLPIGMISRADWINAYVAVLGLLTGYGVGQNLSDFHPQQPDICGVGVPFSILFCAAMSMMLVGFILAVAATGFGGGMHFLQSGIQGGYCEIAKLGTTGCEFFISVLANLTGRNGP
jgi:hypothetical protein